MAYWWLNTNPAIWSFNKISDGETEPFLLYNANNQRRFVPKNFDDIRENDLIIGYESSPTKQIVALCVCSYPSDGKSIGVKKVVQLYNPVCINEIKEHTDLQQMQCFKARTGTLFAMTPGEYNIVYSIIKKHNKNQDI